jgi:hypothetical protein
VERIFEYLCDDLNFVETLPFNKIINLYNENLLVMGLPFHRVEHLPKLDARYAVTDHPNFWFEPFFHFVLNGKPENCILEIYDFICENETQN